MGHIIGMPGSRALAAPSGLIAHWKLNEASNSTRNDSHGTNHLLDVNSNVAMNAGGKIGNCASFIWNEATRYLRCADNSDLSIGGVHSFTLAAWLYSYSASDNRNAVMKWNYPANQREYGMALYTNTFVFFASEDGNSDNDLAQATSVTAAANTWYLVVGWYDATDDKLRIQVNDGTVHATVTRNGAGVFNGTSPLELGYSISGHWDGRIDSVSLWKRTLSSGERTALYNGGSGIDYGTAPII